MMAAVQGFSSVRRLGVTVALAGILAACASGPASNISLIPADQIAEETSKDGLFTQPIRWTHEKPGCKGECPTLEVDSIAFPGVPKLTELVDYALATMTGVSDQTLAPYDSIAGYESYLWQTAAPRDSATLVAKTRYRNKYLTVIELNTWQMFTGAAHGLTATQFLNWDNARARVLGLSDILRAGAHDDYVAALRRAHAEWFKTRPEMQDDPETALRMWPFQPSSNFALTDAGLVVKYNSYEIAPYSSGQPELLIPYADLKGILKAEYMPST